MRDKILDIDYLVKNHKRIYNFGLGFIQVVLSDDTRAHFYSGSVPRTNEEIHNHRYNFTSEIIKGNFIQEKYILVPGDSHLLTNESCSKERELSNVISIETGVALADRSEYCQGETYSIYFNEFHKVDYVGNTITFLTRSKIITDYAQVIFQKGQEKICPFSNRLENDILFQQVEAIIKN